MHGLPVCSLHSEAVSGAVQGTLMSSDFVGPAKGMSVMDFYNKCAFL